MWQVGDFTPDSFVEVITTLLENEDLRKEAKRISRHVSEKEDGVGDAVEAIAELARIWL